jgi:nicotinamide-nucleotide amidase
LASRRSLHGGAMALVPRLVKTTSAQAGGGNGALTALAARVGALLKKRDRPDGRPETISVFEATTGGLINASLQSVPGASRYYHGGANIYGRIGYKLYPKDLAVELSKGGATDGNSNYASEKAYHNSKVHHTTTITSYMVGHLGSDWCIAESGATGPTFAPPDCHTGFTAIAVVGPGVSEVIVVESDTANREENMWQFTAAAFELLEKVLAAPKL